MIDGMNTISDNLGELATTMGATMLTVGADEVVMSIPVQGNRQPFHLLHGGANAVLVEHSASILAQYLAPQGRAAVGTELNISQLRSVTQGTVTARAIPINVGKSSMCALVDIHDDAGNLTATGRMTCVFIHAGQAQ